MNNISTNEKNLSTPERKKQYIQNWLEVSPFVDTSLSIDFGREVTPEPTERCSPKSSTTISTKLEQNQSPFAPTVSPVLGGKRVASSPIIGGRMKKPKQIKLIRPSIKSTKETEPLNKKSYSDKTLIIDNQNTTQPETNNLDNLKKSFCDSTLSIESEQIINENSSLTNIDVTPDIFKVSDPLERHISQIVETEISEEKSYKSSELIVQEIHSDSDKTPSDLIEDISTQLIIKTPLKASCKQFQQSSQVISNPSSDSSDSATNIHVSESTATQPNVNPLSLETFEQTNDIDSPSTLNSKLNLSKTYLLQRPSNNQKRKRNPKKGSLLDSLIVAMAKERSNVNLLRHQLCRKPMTIEEKPFVLLKIIQHLPNMNDNQLITCRLIEDKMNLLEDLMEKNSNFLINIMNVPEISCEINASLKPLLKVYQPWTILDSNQLLLHISRFIAIPSDNVEESEISSDSSKANHFNIMHQFNCPCINRNVLASECKSKFQDSLYDVRKIIFDDKS